MLCQNDELKIVWIDVKDIKGHALETLNPFVCEGFY